VRIEAQTHLNDYNNIGPRIGFTWAPFKSGRTTVRGSWGIFYDWLEHRRLRADAPVRRRASARAERHQSVVPDPGNEGTIPPTTSTCWAPTSIWPGRTG
jgi:hypothetical protein